MVRVRTAKDIGTFIRDRRKRQKLDQATLATMIGVNRRWVMEVERGKPRAEIGLVLKALEALGVDLSVDGSDKTQTLPDLDVVDIDAIVRKARSPAK
jgi:HTH-type transcriptional regulator/antitoxin HipB